MINKNELLIFVQIKIIYVIKLSLISQAICFEKIDNFLKNKFYYFLRKD